MHPYVHCSIIHHSHDMQAAQVFISSWMNKEEVDTNALPFNLYVESKKPNTWIRQMNRLIDTEKLIVSRGVRGWAKMWRGLRGANL